MPVVFQTKCTPPQRRFVDLYIQYGRDYVRAYSESRDHPLKMEGRKLKAKAQAYLKSLTIRNLMKEMDAHALAAIEVKQAYAMDNTLDKYGISKERIMAELAKIAFANAGDVMSWGPDGVIVKASEDLTPDAMAAVGEVVESGGGEKSPTHIKVKLLDKRQALIDLGKELGMFNPISKVEHKGEVKVAAAQFIIEGR